MKNGLCPPPAQRPVQIALRVLRLRRGARLFSTLPNYPPPPVTWHPLVGPLEDPSPPTSPLPLDSHRETVTPGSLCCQAQRRAVGVPQGQLSGWASPWPRPREYAP